MRIPFAYALQSKLGTVESPRMKWIGWTRFSWDLARMTPVYPAVEPQYRIRPALVADEKAVRRMVLAAFTLDADWNYTLGQIREELDAALENLFSEKPQEQAGRACLLVTHGSRIIGASVLNLHREAESHLLTGPCILVEYRNRGLATALLGESLLALREAGVQTAHGLTQTDSPTAQFLYPKFRSLCEPYPRAGTPDRVAG